MRRGLLQPKHVSFQRLLEMSVVHVLSQIFRQTIPHTRTGSREASVAETQTDVHSSRSYATDEVIHCAPRTRGCRTKLPITNLSW